jgi:hypothetical protein
MNTPTTVQDAVNFHRRTIDRAYVQVTHIEPVLKNKWVDVLAPDTFVKGTPWTAPTGLFEVFVTGNIFFNNREYTDYFVLVQGENMWLCHYDNDNAVSKVVQRIHTL